MAGGIQSKLIKLKQIIHQLLLNDNKNCMLSKNARQTTTTTKNINHFQAVIQVMLH